MSARSSLAYIEYPRKSGNLHIYFQMMDWKYYIEDEQGGAVELPKDIAKDFAKVLNEKYKHLIPIDRKREEWERKERRKSKCIHFREVEKFCEALDEAIKIIDTEIERREAGLVD